MNYNIYIIIVLLLVISAVDYKYEKEPFIVEEKKDEEKKPESYEKEDFSELIEEIEEELKFDEPNPWTRINVNNNGNTYHIVIYNFDEGKFMEWKKLVKNVNYDVSKKEFSIKSSSEEKALAIVNLVISHMNNDISVNEIIENRLINKSYLKAKKFPSVKIKLIELIKENNVEHFAMEPKININTQETINGDVVNDNIDNTYCPRPMSGVSAFGGAEFARPF
jgi:hypothetical protein